MSEFFKKIKYVKPRDVGHIFLFLFALPIVFFKKRKRKDLWLICDNQNEADDNGFVFFKFIRTNHPEQDAVFAAGKNCGRKKEIEALGETVTYGSFKHWVLYLSARVNISSQKSGKPNFAVCHLLEVYLGLIKNRVFLQHGVILTNIEFLQFKNTKMNMFLTSTKREYDFVKKHYGYPEKSVVLTGQPRFDRLHNFNTIKGRILIMPTWRQWIGEESFSKNRAEEKNRFMHTEYFKRWNCLLSSEKLKTLCDTYGLKIVFCLHREATRFTDCFGPYGNNVEVKKITDTRLSELLKTAEFLITDYSSIQTDFAYMKKPMAYYHFDYPRFSKEHYKKGYFDYERDGFGPIVFSEEDLVSELKAYAENGFKNTEKYLSRCNSFYTLYDDKNSQRVFEKIKERWS